MQTMDSSVSSVLDGIGLAEDSNLLYIKNFDAHGFQDRWFEADPHTRDGRGVDGDQPDLDGMTLEGDPRTLDKMETETDPRTMYARGIVIETVPRSLDVRIFEADLCTLNNGLCLRFEEYPRSLNARSLKADPRSLYVRNYEEDPRRLNARVSLRFKADPHTLCVRSLEADPRSLHVRQFEADPRSLHVRQFEADPRSLHVRQFEEDPRSLHVRQFEEGPRSLHVRQFEDGPRSLHVRQFEDGPRSLHAKQFEEDPHNLDGMELKGRPYLSGDIRLLGDPHTLKNIHVEGNQHDLDIKGHSKEPSLLEISWDFLLDNRWTKSKIFTHENIYYFRRHYFRRSFCLTNVLLGFMLMMGPTQTFAETAVYASEPGDVLALEGDPVFLNWTTSLAPEDIEWCYWEFAECEGCSGHDLIGYHPQHGGRQNMTSKHHGWTFVNDTLPCQGGIYRRNARMKDVGRYWKRTFTGGKFVRSEVSTLQIYNGGKEQPVELDPAVGERGYVNYIGMSLSDTFPTNGNVDITKNNSEGVSFKILKCCTSAGKTCEFEMTFGTEKNVSIYFFVHTGIQGYPDVVIHQPYVYTYEEHEYTDKDSMPSGVIFALVFSTSALITSITLFVSVWYIRKQRKVKRERKNMEHEGDTKTSFLPVAIRTSSCS